MDQKHREIIRKLNEVVPQKVDQWVGKTYLSSPHTFLGVKTDHKRAVAKTFYKENKTLSKRDFLKLLDRLYKGETFEERTLASELIFLYKDYWEEISLADLDGWLGNLVGWAEIDTLCQSEILQTYLVKDFKTAAEFIRKLSTDSNINKRRASLVLLVKPASYLSDKRIFALSIETVQRLKNEKPVIITKAISWILRALSNHHKRETKEYIGKNRDSLPKIAIRETLKKIETGKKT